MAWCRTGGQTPTDAGESSSSAWCLRKLTTAGAASCPTPPHSHHATSAEDKKLATVIPTANPQSFGVRALFPIGAVDRLAHAAAQDAEPRGRLLTLSTPLGQLRWMTRRRV